MASRGGEIIYAVTLDDFAYAIDEISHCRIAIPRLRFRHVGSVHHRFADCSSLRVFALAVAVVENTVDASSVDIMSIR
jgi:hypothetical protein